MSTAVNPRDVAVKAIPLLEDLRDLMTTLTQDVIESAIEAQPGGQRQRRAYVRAAFALVEGVLSGSKTFLIEVQPIFATPPTTAEVCLLEERTYSLGSAGEVRGRPQFMPVGDNVRFMLGLSEKAFGTPLSIDCGGKGWSDFRAAISIRNRLMHPRRLADCNVTIEGAAATDSAVKWFRESTQAFYKAGIERMLLLRG